MHIYACRQAQSEPTQPPACRKVYFTDERDDNYHIHLKKKNKKLADPVVELIANNFSKKGEIA